MTTFPPRSTSEPPGAESPERQRVTSLLMDAMYGELGAKEREELSGKLAEDENLGEEFKQLGELRTRMRQALAASPIPGPSEAVVEAIRAAAAARVQARVPWWRRHRWLAGLGTMTALGAAVAGFLLLQQSPGSKPGDARLAEQVGRGDALPPAPSAATPPSGGAVEAGGAIGGTVALGEAKDDEGGTGAAMAEAKRGQARAARDEALVDLSKKEFSRDEYPAKARGLTLNGTRKDDAESFARSPVPPPNEEGTSSGIVASSSTAGGAAGKAAMAADPNVDTIADGAVQPAPPKPTASSAPVRKGSTTAQANAPFAKEPSAPPAASALEDGDSKRENTSRRAYDSSVKPESEAAAGSVRVAATDEGDSDESVRSDRVRAKTAPLPDIRQLVKAGRCAEATKAAQERRKLDASYTRARADADLAPCTAARSKKKAPTTKSAPSSAQPKQADQPAKP